MAKTSKIVPQKEVVSSSRPAGEKPAVEPRPKELIPEGLGKEATMRPPSGDEEVSHLSRNRESVQRLREEEEEEEEEEKEEKEDDSGMVARARASIEIQRTTEPAFVLHHEAFFRSRGEMSSEQREGEAKGFRDELEAAQNEQVDLAEQVKRIFEVNDIDSDVEANSSVPQVQLNIDVIGQLREEVNAVKAEAEAWKKNMDRRASEKEAARAQLASTENQLQSLKEKALRLATELAAAKSEVEMAKANVDAMVAVYRSDTEAIIFSVSACSNSK
nr:neurofilament medium polypeptide-like [Nicotiana tomentosiformis]